MFHRRYSFPLILGKLSGQHWRPLAVMCAFHQGRSLFNHHACVCVLLCVRLYKCPAPFAGAGLWVSSQEVFCFLQEGEEGHKE